MRWRPPWPAGRRALRQTREAPSVSMMQARDRPACLHPRLRLPAGLSAGRWRRQRLPAGLSVGCRRKQRLPAGLSAGRWRWRRWPEPPCRVHSYCFPCPQERTPGCYSPHPLVATAPAVWRSLALQRTVSGQACRRRSTTATRVASHCRRWPRAVPASPERRQAESGWCPGAGRPAAAAENRRGEDLFRWPLPCRLCAACSR